MNRILITLISSLLLATNGYSQTTNKQPVTDKKIAWNYPIKQGMEEWKSCKSPAEIYKKLQMPENILKNMDTESLAQICLDYPAPTIFYIFNTPQEGFEGFYRQFNGIRELMNRKDVGSVLLKKYADMSLNDFNPLWTLEKQGEFLSKFYYIELFLVQPSIVRSFDASERKALLKETVNKFDLKQSRADLFGGYSRGATVWVMAQTLASGEKLNMSKAAHSAEAMTSSLKSGMLMDIDVQDIYQQAKSYSHE